MDARELYELSAKYLNGEATEEERKKLQQWYEDGSDSQIPIVSAYPDKAGMEDALYERIKASIKPAAPVKKINWLRWVAAAMLLLTGSAAYFFFIGREGQSIRHDTAIGPDIQAPGTTRATLKLANGQIIYLDSAGNGSLALQGNIKIIKTEDGQLIYRAEPGSESGSMEYNTIANPRGSRVQQVTLSDGTQLWLNAASSITYPVSFADNERKVLITGEAYFEVAKDPKKKFMVDANGVITEVLGTHFNINSYSNESEIKVTLLEGSIRVSSQSATDGFDPVVIKPGEQAIANGNKQLTVHKDVDLDEVMAWKNGQFILNGTDIQGLMRQISRWYDVDVVYKSVPAEKEFGGSIDSSIPLSRLVQALEENGVRCKLEGRVLTIGN